MLKVISLFAMGAAVQGQVSIQGVVNKNPSQGTYCAPPPQTSTLFNQRIRVVSTDYQAMVYASSSSAAFETPWKYMICWTEGPGTRACYVQYNYDYSTCPTISYATYPSVIIYESQCAAYNAKEYGNNACANCGVGLGGVCSFLMNADVQGPKPVFACLPKQLVLENAPVTLDRYPPRTCRSVPTLLGGVDDGFQEGDGNFTINSGDCSSLCGTNTVCNVALNICEPNCPAIVDPCCAESDSPTCGGQAESSYAECVCAFDDWCCSTGWDGQCIYEVTEICGLTC